MAKAQADRTHCPAGHLYDEANTYITADGSRSCRACKREQSRLWRPNPDRTTCSKGHADLNERGQCRTCKRQASAARRGGRQIRSWKFDAPGVCAVADCDDPTFGWGYCTSHFLRAKRHGGDPLAGGAFRDHRPLAERFMDSVEVAPDHWRWLGNIAKSTGYGRVRSEGVTVLAHRVSWELHVGPIPEGMVLDHLCHNVDLTCRETALCPHRRCVWPAHLEVVTPSENTRRMARRKAAIKALLMAS